MLPDDPVLRGRLLRAARDLLGWTQARVAGEAGVSTAAVTALEVGRSGPRADRKSTRLNSSHANISYAVFCLKKKQDKTLYRQSPRHNSSDGHIVYAGVSLKQD